jgi:hypothetical protein
MEFSKILTDMRAERTCSKVAAKRAVKIRSIVQKRVGALDVDLCGHVLQALSMSAIPAGVMVDSFSCRGKLWKKGQIHRNWNQRWFLFDLKERRLSYYSDEACTNMKGAFMLEEVQSVSRVSDCKDYPFLMNIATPERVFHFRSDIEAVLNVWLTVFDSIAPLDE